MMLGFVVIVYPEKYISLPDIDQDDFSREAEDVKEKFLNETNAEIAAAGNSSEVERIESGNISSHERFHYLERLKDAQDEGVEGMHSYMLHYVSLCPNKTAGDGYQYNSILILNFSVIITAMVTIVTTILLVVGVRKASKIISIVSTLSFILF